jgi:hypothetical protein
LPPTEFAINQTMNQTMVTASPLRVQGPWLRVPFERE